MEEITLVTGIAHAIQLSVAPVFLIVAIGGMLGIFSGRLGRITDRVRIVETRLYAINSDTDKADRLRQECKILWRRVSLINSAIRLCTYAVLIVCLVIAVIFIGYHTYIDLSPVISVLFICAVLVMFIGLLFFLGEVHLATKTMRNGIQILAQDVGDFGQLFSEKNDLE